MSSRDRIPVRLLLSAPVDLRAEWEVLMTDLPYRVEKERVMLAMKEEFNKSRKKALKKMVSPQR